MLSVMIHRFALYRRTQHYLSTSLGLLRATCGQQLQLERVNFPKVTSCQRRHKHDESDNNNNNENSNSNSSNSKKRVRLRHLKPIEVRIGKEVHRKCKYDPHVPFHDVLGTVPTATVTDGPETSALKSESIVATSENRPPPPVPPQKMNQQPVQPVTAPEIPLQPIPEAPFKETRPEQPLTSPKEANPKEPIVITCDMSGSNEKKEKLSEKGSIEIKPLPDSEFKSESEVNAERRKLDAVAKENAVKSAADKAEAEKRVSENRATENREAEKAEAKKHETEKIEEKNRVGEKTEAKKVEVEKSKVAKQKPEQAAVETPIPVTSKTTAEPQRNIEEEKSDEAKKLVANAIKTSIAENEIPELVYDPKTGLLSWVPRKQPKSVSEDSKKVNTQSSETEEAEIDSEMHMTSQEYTYDFEESETLDNLKEATEFFNAVEDARDDWGDANIMDSEFSPIENYEFSETYTTVEELKAAEPVAYKRIPEKISTKSVSTKKVDLNAVAQANKDQTIKKVDITSSTADVTKKVETKSSPTVDSEPDTTLNPSLSKAIKEFRDIKNTQLSKAIKEFRKEVKPESSQAETAPTIERTAGGSKTEKANSSITLKTALSKEMKELGKSSKSETVATSETVASSKVENLKTLDEWSSLPKRTKSKGATAAVYKVEKSKGAVKRGVQEINNVKKLDSALSKPNIWDTKSTVSNEVPKINKIKPAKQTEKIKPIVAGPSHTNNFGVKKSAIAEIVEKQNSEARTKKQQEFNKNTSQIRSIKHNPAVANSIFKNNVFKKEDIIQAKETSNSKNPEKLIEPVEKLKAVSKTNVASNSEKLQPYVSKAAAVKSEKLTTKSAQREKVNTYRANKPENKSSETEKVQTEHLKPSISTELTWGKPSSSKTRKSDASKAGNRPVKMDTKKTNTTDISRSISEKVQKINKQSENLQADLKPKPSLSTQFYFVQKSNAETVKPEAAPKNTNKTGEDSTEKASLTNDKSQNIPSCADAVLRSNTGSMALGQSVEPMPINEIIGKLKDQDPTIYSQPKTVMIRTKPIGQSESKVINELEQSNIKAENDSKSEVENASDTVKGISHDTDEDIYETNEHEEHYKLKVKREIQAKSTSDAHEDENESQAEDRYAEEVVGKYEVDQDINLDETKTSANKMGETPIEVKPDDRETGKTAAAEGGELDVTLVINDPAEKVPEQPKPTLAQYLYEKIRSIGSKSKESKSTKDSSGNDGKRRMSTFSSVESLSRLDNNSTFESKRSLATLGDKPPLEINKNQVGHSTPTRDAYIKGMSSMDISSNPPISSEQDFCLGKMTTLENPTCIEIDAKEPGEDKDEQYMLLLRPVKPLDPTQVTAKSGFINKPGLPLKPKSIDDIVILGGTSATVKKTSFCSTTKEDEPCPESSSKIEIKGGTPRSIIKARQEREKQMKDKNKVKIFGGTKCKSTERKQSVEGEGKKKNPDSCKSDFSTMRNFFRMLWYYIFPDASTGANKPKQTH